LGSTLNSFYQIIHLLDLLVFTTVDAYFVLCQADANDAHIKDHSGDICHSRTHIILQIVAVDDDNIRATGLDAREHVCQFCLGTDNFKVVLLGEQGFDASSKQTG